MKSFKKEEGGRTGKRGGEGSAIEGEAKKEGKGVVIG